MVESGQKEENPFTEEIQDIGLLDRIEDLQDAKNPKVYEKARELLERYFNCEMDDVDDMHDVQGDQETQKMQTHTNV